MSTGMSRRDLMNLYEEMRNAQELRLQQAYCEDGDARAAYLGFVDTPTALQQEVAVTLPRFLRSIRGTEPPSKEQLAAWDASWEIHGAAVAEAWQLDIKGGTAA